MMQNRVELDPIYHVIHYAIRVVRRHIFPFHNHRD